MLVKRKSSLSHCYVSNNKKYHDKQNDGKNNSLYKVS